MQRYYSASLINVTRNSSSSLVLLRSVKPSSLVLPQVRPHSTMKNSRSRQQQQMLFLVVDFHTCYQQQITSTMFLPTTTRRTFFSNIFGSILPKTSTDPSSTTATATAQQQEQQQEQQKTASGEESKTTAQSVFDTIGQVGQATYEQVSVGASSIISALTHLKNMGIEKLGKQSQENALNTLSELSDKGGASAQMGMTEEGQQNYKSITDSLSSMLNDPNHPINSMQVELTGMYRLAAWVPFYSTVEWLFKCVVFQSLDIILRILLYSNQFTVEQKEVIVKDVSGIIVKNAVDPLSLASDLVDYSIKMANLDPEHTQRIQLLVSLLPYLRTVLQWVKKIPGPHKK